MNVSLIKKISHSIGGGNLDGLESDKGLILGLNTSTRHTGLY